MTQKDRLLELLSDGAWHDNRELNEICFAYSQRINEMVRAGEIEVETTHDPHNSAHWYWRVTKMTPKVINDTREYRQMEMAI